jgi:uncharacterized protein (TIGR00725 family)
VRKPVVGVMGGSSVSPEVEQQAETLGGLIAERGWVLLTGGRSVGVMEASSRGAKAAGGIVLGILPDRDDHRATEHLDFAVFTGMGDGRNLINVLSSDVVIACPGNTGTLSEIALALTAGRPTISLGFDLRGSVVDEYRERGLYVPVDTAATAIDTAAYFLENALPHRTKLIPPQD